MLSRNASQIPWLTALFFKIYNLVIVQSLRCKDVFNKGCATGRPRNVSKLHQLLVIEEVSLKIIKYFSA